MDTAGAPPPPSSSYALKLEAEKTEWEALYRKSKRDRKRLQRRHEQGQHEQPELASEDRRFLLESRPDYEGFCRLLEVCWKRRLAVLVARDSVEHRQEQLLRHCRALKHRVVGDALAGTTASL